jgi:hypothetical protein
VRSGGKFAYAGFLWDKPITTFAEGLKSFEKPAGGR